MIIKVKKRQLFHRTFENFASSEWAKQDTLGRKSHGFKFSPLNRFMNNNHNYLV